MLTAVKRNTNGTILTRVSLKGILGISFLAALTYAPFINAAQRVVVNEAQIQVEDQTQRTQQNALKITKMPPFSTKAYAFTRPLWQLE